MWRVLLFGNLYETREWREGLGGGRGVRRRRQRRGRLMSRVSGTRSRIQQITYRKQGIDSRMRSRRMTSRGRIGELWVRAMPRRLGYRDGRDGDVRLSLQSARGESAARSAGTRSTAGTLVNGPRRHPRRAGKGQVLHVERADRRVANILVRKVADKLCIDRARRKRRSIGLHRMR